MKNFILIFCCSFFIFGCVQTTTLAPSFIGSGGNIYKTSLSYGGNYLIKKEIVVCMGAGSISKWIREMDLK